MPTRNSKRLDAINAKIADLQKLKNKLEDNFVQDASKDVAKLLVKHKTYNIDKSVLLKKIESAIGAI